jgi:hypothetical protein
MVGVTSCLSNTGISFAVSFDTNCHTWSKMSLLSFPARKLQEVMGSARAFQARS